MSDLKLSEFRERVLRATPLPDLAAIERRGRVHRQRRTAGAVAGLAACIGLGLGIVAVLGNDDDPDAGPIESPQPTETSRPASSEPRMLIRGSIGQLSEGDYYLDNLDPGGAPDASVRLVGTGWEGYEAGAYQSTGFGEALMGWGVDELTSVPVDPCRLSGKQRPTPTTVAAMAEQLSQLQRLTVTRAPTRVSQFGRSGMHLQLEVGRDACPASGEPGYGGPDAYTWFLSDDNLDGPPDTDITFDVWVLKDGDRIVVVGKAVTEWATPADREKLDETLSNLRLAPRS
jgi:hypothetical protein